MNIRTRPSRLAVLCVALAAACQSMSGTPYKAQSLRVFTPEEFVRVEAPGLTMLVGRLIDEKSVVRVLGDRSRKLATFANILQVSVSSAAPGIGISRRSFSLQMPAGEHIPPLLPHQVLAAVSLPTAYWVQADHPPLADNPASSGRPAEPTGSQAPKQRFSPSAPPALTSQSKMPAPSTTERLHGTTLCGRQRLIAPSQPTKPLTSSWSSHLQTGRSRPQRPSRSRSSWKWEACSGRRRSRCRQGRGRSALVPSPHLHRLGLTSLLVLCSTPFRLSCSLSVPQRQQRPTKPPGALRNQSSGSFTPP